MIKVMLILWYLLIGIIGFIASGLVIGQSLDTESRLMEVVCKAVLLFFIIVFFLIIALMPNFIGAVIQWIVSLFH